MKKMFNLMLIFVLTLVSFIPGVSAVANAGDGSITVTGTKSGEIYKVYQILVLDSYADIDGTSGMGDNDGYIYKVPENDPAKADWYDFVTTTSYLTVDGEGYVKWNEGDQAQFAKDALKYAKDNSIAADATLTGNGSSITFSGLNYGYYLVDSSLGALCGLRTTKKDATVNEKNTDPTVTKQVEEKGTYGSENSAFIGETVNFKTTINVGSGADSYVLYDTMSDGLDFVSDSIVVKVGTATLEEGTDYTVDYQHKDGYTFVITFKTTLAEDKDVVVTYSAIVTNGAVVGENGNSNSTTLKYGNNQSISSRTTTYTYSFDLVKTDDSNKLLNGAEFELYEQDKDDEEKLGRKICLIDSGNNTYTVSNTGSGETCSVIRAGKVTIKGLDTGNYYLVETKNPDGYSKLLDYKAVAIGSANNSASMKDDGVTYDKGGVQVINKKGNLLPETGGIGTTLFITIGSLMMLLFGLLLVTKVRMSKMDV